ncbi:hypothetical protein VRRI112168_01640 [Vreelandella rituensis]
MWDNGTLAKSNPGAVGEHFVGCNRFALYADHFITALVSKGKNPVGQAKLAERIAYFIGAQKGADFSFCIWGLGACKG